MQSVHQNIINGWLTSAANSKATGTRSSRGASFVDAFRPEELLEININLLNIISRFGEVVQRDTYEV